MEGSALPKKKARAAGMNDTITAFARLADQARSLFDLTEQPSDSVWTGIQDKLRMQGPEDDDCVMPLTV